nr:MULTISPECIES: hypothetical protein [Mesorhizobium]
MTLGISPLGIYTEHITGAPRGLYYLWCTRIHFDLSAQAQNLNIDAAIEDVLVNAGGPLKVLSGQWLIGRLEEGNQKSVFSLCERYWPLPEGCRSCRVLKRSSHPPNNHLPDSVFGWFCTEVAKRRLTRALMRIESSRIDNGLLKYSSAPASSQANISFSLRWFPVTTMGILPPSRRFRKISAPRL